MNRRKLLLLALAIGLPLALVVPLLVARSRQPRELKLAYRPTILTGQRDVTALLWRANGLLLARANVPLQTGPLPLKNWDGQTLQVRAVEADQVSLDASGHNAALVYRRSMRLEHDLWDVEAGKSRGIIAGLKGGQKHQHNAPGLDNWVISPDGGRLAWEAPATHSVLIGDAKTAQTDANFKFDAPIYNYTGLLVFSPNSRELAVIGDSTAWFVDARNGQKRRHWSFNGSIVSRSAQWSPDGKYLALWWGHPLLNGLFAPPPLRTGVFLRVFDAQTGALVQSWSQTKTLRDPEGVTGVSFAPDGKHLAFGTFDGNAHLLNLQSGQIERHFPSPGASKLPDPAHYVAYAPDGQTLAVATGDRILLWRVE